MQRKQKRKVSPEVEERKQGIVATQAAREDDPPERARVSISNDRMFKATPCVSLSCLSASRKHLRRIRVSFPLRTGGRVAKRRTEKLHQIKTIASKRLSSTDSHAGVVCTMLLVMSACGTPQAPSCAVDVRTTLNK